VSQQEPRTSEGRGATDAERLLVQRYYSYFNDRDFVAGAALFAEDATLEQLPLRPQERGGIGYLQFVSTWIRAFPDAVLRPDRITRVADDTFEADLALCGIHQGPLELGGWVFRPTGNRATIRFRELLRVRHGWLVFASVSLDLHEIIETLTTFDDAKLLEHLRRLQELGGRLTAAQGDPAERRGLAEEIGRELDAARHVVRPYYRRSR
jgi:SnoaL-like domain